MNTDNDFADASEQPQPGLIAELFGFLKCNKKWWLAPILVMMGLLGALMLIGSGAAAPFIYTLF